MITMKKAVNRIKGNLPRFLPDPLIDRLIRQAGIISRDRKLNPKTTTSLFFRQMLHGNIPVPELVRLSHLDFTDSAYCQARQRLPAHFFRQLSQAVSDVLATSLRQQRTGRWRRKHRVFIFDGSSFSMPDSKELRDTFRYPGGQKEGCGFPTAHLLVRTDLSNGYLLDAVVAPWNTHDLADVQLTHGGLQAGDVILGDTAFCSYAHLALLKQRGVHALFPVHQRQIVDFTPGREHVAEDGNSKESRGKPRSRWIRSQGEQDQIVEYFKPRERPSWMTEEEYAALPKSIRVREIRLQVRDRHGKLKEMTLVTTLLDAEEYSKKSLGELYEKRWRVEVGLRHLKEQLKLGVLRCETVPGVIKELYVIVALYNLVRRVMVEAGKRQKVTVDRISFADALYWLRHSEAGEEVPKLKVVPRRPGRAEPRVKKRRPKPYSLMTQPRQDWHEKREREISNCPIKTCA